MKRALLIFPLIAGFLSSRVCAQSATVSTASAANHVEHGERLRASGLPNFGKINEHLFRGAQPHEAGLRELKRLGVTTIVDLRGEDRPKMAWEKRQSEALGIRFVHIPVSGWSPPTDTQVAQFLAIFKEDPEERVFVHCRLGDDRTGVFVATYRMVFDGFLSDEALHEMYFFGFNGSWHPSMTTFIHEFPRRLATDPPLAPFKSAP